MGLRLRHRARFLAHELLIKARPPKGKPPDITVKDDTGSTVVDDYWNRHTLHELRFTTAGRPSFLALAKMWAMPSAM